MAAIIVGDADDPHVEAIVSGLQERNVRFVITNAETAFHQFRWKDGALQLLGLGEAEHVRGWIRRLSPPSWGVGVTVGSAEATATQAKMAYLAMVLRDERIHWLSPVYQALRAENKLYQQAVLRGSGIRTPSTRVSGNPFWRDSINPNASVVKPLGPGQYVESDVPYHVFARELNPTDSHLLNSLERAPFLIQERLDAIFHYRVVTVNAEAWGARLSAEDLPMDWRLDESAHGSFVEFNLESLAEQASFVAGQLGLGYSSQDWIATSEDLFLLDVNPGGQWLFLPTTITTKVNQAISAWLAST